MTTGPGAEASLLYDDVQEQLRASVAELLADHNPMDRLLADLDSGVTHAELWRWLARDLGCAGLAVPEDAGGAGASWSEVAVVAEELGRSLAPVPFLGSAVLATAALGTAAESELLPALAAGERTAVLAVPFGTQPSAGWPSRVRVDGDRLTGAVSGVADATVADEVLLCARDGDRPVLCAVAADEVRRDRLVSLDETRPLCEITVRRVAGRRIAEGQQAEDALRTALNVGAAVLASEQLGVAERAIELTVTYLKERTQFGRPIGSFQALKHRVADVWVDVSQGRAVACYAASCAARGDADLPVAAALAQAYLSPVAVHACEEMLQLHGGIGFTWEHPAHAYLKRAKSAALALGTAARHRIALAELVDLPRA